MQGSLIYRNGEPLVDDERNFPHNTEVTFNCIESIMGEKNTWRIVCEDGSWIGRSLNCGNDYNHSLHYSSEAFTVYVFFLFVFRSAENEDGGKKHHGNNNSTCLFRNQEPNVISFYNDQHIREDVVEFPAGATLVSRCIDIGKYAMIGIFCYLQTTVNLYFKILQVQT